MRCNTAQLYSSALQLEFEHFYRKIGYSDGLTTECQLNRYLGTYLHGTELVEDPLSSLLVVLACLPTGYYLGIYAKIMSREAISSLS